MVSFTAPELISALFLASETELGHDRNAFVGTNAMSKSLPRGSRPPLLSAQVTGSALVSEPQSHWLNDPSELEIHSLPCVERKWKHVSCVRLVLNLGFRLERCRFDRRPCFLVYLKSLIAAKHFECASVIFKGTFSFLLSIWYLSDMPFAALNSVKN